MIDATIGGAASNSFVTWEEAVSIISQMMFVPPEWIAATEEDNKIALIDAGRRINNLSYRGEKKTTTQALIFPIIFEPDVPGVELISGADIHPLQVKLAQVNLALRLRQLEDTNQPNPSQVTSLEALGITKVKADVVEVQFKGEGRQGNGLLIPADILGLIPEHWLRGSKTVKRSRGFIDFY